MSLGLNMIFAIVDFALRMSAGRMVESAGIVKVCMLTVSCQGLCWAGRLELRGVV